MADFEQAGDHRDAANALRLLGVLTGARLEAADLHERARAHAHEAGDERLALLIARHIAAIALWGPEPVEPALARCRAILAEASSNSSGLVQASCLMRIGGLQGLAGEFEAARATIAEARAIMDDLGLRHQKAHSTDVAVLVEMLAEDYEAAEREARHAYAVLEEMGDLTYQASEGLLIAAALERQGRTDEAEEWLAISERGRRQCGRSRCPRRPGTARSPAADASRRQSRWLSRRSTVAPNCPCPRSRTHASRSRRSSIARAAEEEAAEAADAVPRTIRGEGHRAARPEGEGAARPRSGPEVEAGTASTDRR